MFGYRQRRLLASSLKRSVRWEFWPMWLFYIPVGCYIALLTLRYRGLAFTAVNPGMDSSGFVGEKKSDSLLLMQNSIPENIALTELVSREQTLAEQKKQCLDFILRHGLSFPIILKPDCGQRGVDVAIIENETEILEYLKIARFDSIVQEYIAGVEFGVFYCRRPHEPAGEIFSLTHKCFPFITGNGSDNLETLILNHPRLHYMARFLLNKYQDQLLHVPAHNEVVDVVRIGSHCRGSLFLDGNEYHSAALAKNIDAVSQQLPEFYFGRYDVRAENVAELQRGNFKVIEVNGVTSESTNIYDPKNSVLTAYKILFSQWKLAFEIGQQNIHRGHPTTNLLELLNKAWRMNREVKV